MTLFFRWELSKYGNPILQSGPGQFGGQFVKSSIFLPWDEIDQSDGITCVATWNDEEVNGTTGK